MKKLPFIILVLIFSGLVSCANSSGGGDSSDSDIVRPSFSVTNLTFDSLTYALTADVTLADETKLTLECNKKQQFAVVSKGKIAVVFDAPFYTGVKGGKSYNLTFKADGYANASGTIQYWPKLESELTSKSQITVYNGEVEHLEVPEVILLNYEPNSVSKNVTFTILDSNNYQIGESETSWTFDDLKNFLSIKENAGKIVKYEYKIIPNISSNTDLSDEGEVIYISRNEIEVKSAYIHNDFGRFEVYLYDGSDEASEENAGGIINYQWQVLNDDSTYTDISGATGKTFTLTKENASTYLGKTLRVKIIQNFRGSNQPELYSNTFPVYHVKKIKDLYYDGVLTVGEVFDCSKIKGIVTDELGNKYDAVSFKWYGISEKGETNYYVASSSKKFIVNCEKADFYPMDGAEIFAVVQSILTNDEIPPLSTDILSISAGNCKFKLSDKDLEVSFNSCATFIDIPEGEFETYEGHELYIRKKSSGKPNKPGYIKESEPVKIIVKKENVGVKTSGSGFITGIEVPKLSLSVINKNNKNYLITPSIDLDASKYTFNYSWKFETTSIINGSEKSGVTIEDNCLVVDKNKVSANIHRITCFAQIYSNSTGETMTVLASTTIDLR